MKLQNIKSTKRKRALRKLAHASKYSGADLMQRWEDFNGCCAYCGKGIAFKKETTFDHFLPISQGGTDTIGNLIPACLNCNSQKQKQDPEIWYKKQPFFTRKRWRLILKILGKTESNYNQLPLL
jgi:5-methylcytosine-specific restriction endonuclease McrA